MSNVSKLILIYLERGFSRIMIHEYNIMREMRIDTESRKSKEMSKILKTNQQQMTLHQRKFNGP